MAKPRHHRKVKQNRFNSKASQFVAEASLAADPAITVELSAPVDENVVSVRHDLRTTLFTMAALALLLVLASFLNVKYGWTFKFGSLLYSWLHIR